MNNLLSTCAKASRYSKESSGAGSSRMNCLSRPAASLHHTSSQLNWSLLKRFSISSRNDCAETRKSMNYNDYRVSVQCAVGAFILKITCCFWSSVHLSFRNDCAETRKSTHYNGYRVSVIYTVFNVIIYSFVHCTKYGCHALASTKINGQSCSLAN